MIGCPHAPYVDGGGDFGIGLAPITPEIWLEGGETPEAIRRRKRGLFDTTPSCVWAEAPGSRAAQAEALELVAEAAGVQPATADEPPLLQAAGLVADDLCLLERREGGWTLVALSLCAGTFFTAEQVIGKTLAELHAPVPGFDGRFLVRVARIFDNLRPELILQRRNWTVINSDALHLADPEPIRARVGEITAETAAEALHVRVERQTIRRLPRTGAVLFTIRVWREPLSAIRADPERLDGFASAWRTAAADFRSYKQLGLYDELVERILEQSLA